MKRDLYKQCIPELQLSIESNTPGVPADNNYYVIKENVILSKYRSLKKAEELYKAIVKQSGYKPKPVKGKSLAELTVQEYLDRGEESWISRGH